MKLKQFECFGSFKQIITGCSCYCSSACWDTVWSTVKNNSFISTTTNQIIMKAVVDVGGPVNILVSV